MTPVAVVTGGSSGIGLAAARLFAEKGYNVFELSRRGSDIAGVEHITADVCDEASVAAAFSGIRELAGRLDVLLCCAGFGISGAVELTDTEAAARLFDVNFFGVLRCVKAAVPLLRESGGGAVVLTSSVAAELAIPFQSFYSASKAAVNALTLTLANELRPFAIRVAAVMPGDVKTGFTDAREKGADEDNLYSGAIDRAVGAMEKDERNGMPPELVARVMYKAATRARPRPFYVAGGKYRLFMALARLLPKRLTNFIVGKMYG